MHIHSYHLGIKKNFSNGLINQSINNESIT